MAKNFKSNICSRILSRVFRYQKEDPNRTKKWCIKLIVFCAGILLRTCRREIVSLFSFFYKKPTRLKILIMLSGGLGDHIECLQYVRKLAIQTENSSDIFIYSNLSPDCVWGTFGSVSNDFFPPNVFLKCKGKIEKNHDLEIIISRLPVITFCNKKRILEKDSWLVDYLDKIETSAREINGLFDEGTILDSIAMQISKVLGKNRHTQYECIAQIPVPEKNIELKLKLSKSSIREKFGLKNAYVTLQRGVQGNASGTKCWPIENYEKFVALFKSLFPQVKFVQIGAETCHRIEGVDFDLCGKTNFEELKTILKYAIFHLDGECGLVHLNHILGGKSVVLFGPTDENYYSYPENLNIFKRPCGVSCEWLVGNWQQFCLFTRSSSAPCMKLITPENVFEKVKENFSEELKHI